MKKPSINAIYKTNKCPTFYLCNDGTYSDKNGRNACNRHGGLNKGTTAPTPERLRWNAQQWKDREPLPPFADGGSWKLKSKEIQSNDFFEIRDFTNTKTGKQLKLVILKKRVDSTTFDIFRQNAKSAGGFYSTFAKGFLFDNIFDAENFMNNAFDKKGKSFEQPKEQKSYKKEPKIKKPAIKKVGKISFKMPTGEELKEGVAMGKNALDVINSVGYKDRAPLYKNPSFLNPLLIYLKDEADKTPDKYARGRGDFYRLEYDGIKAIAPIWFKEMYPDAKNVRISRPDYNNLVLSATFPAVYKENKREIEKNAHSLLWQFNYDNSDPMTDYFHTRFYLNENISFEDAELSKKNKDAPKYFWVENKRVGGTYGWDLAEFYFGRDDKNKPSYATKIQLKRKKTESYQDVLDRAIAKYSKYGVNLDGVELSGSYGGYGINKKTLSSGDITEKQAWEFYNNTSISGTEGETTIGNKVANFVFYNSDFVGYSVLAFLTFKALSKWTKK